jgi:hypothetical protein
MADEATLSRAAPLRIEPNRDTSSRYFNSRECNMALVRGLPVKKYLLHAH